MTVEESITIDANSARRGVKTLEAWLFGEPVSFYIGDTRYEEKCAQVVSLNYTTLRVSTYEGSEKKCLIEGAWINICGDSGLDVNLYGTVVFTLS